MGPPRLLRLSLLFLTAFSLALASSSSAQQLTTADILAWEPTPATRIAYGDDPLHFGELRLPEGASIRGVRVADRTASPRVGENGTVLIPLLSDQQKDQAFLVALYYDHDVERSGAAFEDVRLQTPEPIDANADILTWRVMMPDERQYTSFGGSVERVDGHRSWAVRLLEGLGGVLVSKADKPTNVHQLIASYVSPFTKRKHKRPYFEFQGRIGAGSVEITSTSKSFFLFWKLIWFVLAFVLARFALRMASSTGVGIGAVYGVFVLALLALLIPAGPGASQVYTAMLMGVLVSGLFSFLGWMSAGRDEALEEAEEHEPPADDPPVIDPTEPAPEGGAA